MLFLIHECTKLQYGSMSCTVNYCLILSILLSSGPDFGGVVRCSVVNCTLGHLALHWGKSYDSWNHNQMEMG